MRVWRQTVCCLTVLGVALAYPSATQAQGTIAHFRPTTPISFGPVPGFEYCQVDLNGDGRIDLVFDSTRLIWTAVSPQGGSRLLMLPEPPPDLGGYLQPLAEGTSISGASAQNGLVWFDGSGLVAGATLSACAWPFGCVGPWLGQTAYAGVELQFNGQTHYGWLRISHFEFSNGGVLIDWAYETRPGMPILAGAVPEPSTWALLVAGGVVVVWFRRKRNARKG